MGARMNTKVFGALAACAAGLAVLSCTSRVALDAPAPVTVAMVAAAILLVAAAGGLVGAAVVALRGPKD